MNDVFIIPYINIDISAAKSKPNAAKPKNGAITIGPTAQPFCSKINKDKISIDSEIIIA